MNPLKCNRSFLLFFLCFGLVLNSYGQKSKKQLEKEKKENIKKIKEASKILEQTKVEKKVTLGQLSAINEKVRAQNQLVRTINQEIAWTERDITDNQSIIKSINEDVEELKKEYAKMVYEASKTDNGYNKLLFMFSSESLIEIYLRYKFLEEYAEARKVQAEQIIKVSNELQLQNQLLVSKKEEKEKLLSSVLVEFENLSSVKQEKKSILANLKGREQEVRKELAEREKSVRELEKLIEALLKAEIAKAAKKAKKGEKKSGLSLTPEAKLLSNSFAENKGRLGWPVEYGFISHKFGKHNHPDIPGVVVDNLGVDVQTKKGSEVRSVFDGKVSAVAVVPGMQSVVMIQHGEYFTVYAKIEHVKVKMGDIVKRKDVIGMVHTKSNGVSEVQFQVWKTNSKLNPEKWIFKK